jgi:hypothetical protein
MLSQLQARRACSPSFALSSSERDFCVTCFEFPTLHFDGTVLLLVFLVDLSFQVRRDPI